MASLTTDDVLSLAKLAQLALSPEEVEQFKGEINEILGYVDQLQGVDVSGLEPTYQVTGLKNVMRADEVKRYQATPDDLLNVVPETDGRLIKVKRMVG